jgi:serine protease Do
VLTIPYQKRDLGLELRRNEEADPSDESGVLVSSVQNGSKASEAGLESGDVILEVDGIQQSDPDSCYRLLKTRSEDSGRPTILRIERGHERWFIALASDKNGR